MNFVHNDRLRTVHDDIQTVKIDIVYILIEYIILYGIILHVYHYIRRSFLTEPDSQNKETVYGGKKWSIWLCSLSISGRYDMHVGRRVLPRNEKFYGTNTFLYRVPLSLFLSPHPHNTQSITSHGTSSLPPQPHPPPHRLTDTNSPITTTTTPLLNHPPS